MGGKGIKGLKARVERECCISRGGTRMNSGAYKLEESEEEVTELVGVGSPEKAGMQQGEALGMRAAKSSDSRKGVVSTSNKFI